MRPTAKAHGLMPGARSPSGLPLLRSHWRSAPGGLEEVQDAVGGNGCPVGAIVELVPQLVAGLLELEYGADPGQLRVGGWYEPRGAVLHCQPVALEEGATRMLLPGRETEECLGAPFGWTPPRRRGGAGACRFAPRCSSRAQLRSLGGRTRRSS